MISRVGAAAVRAKGIAHAHNPHCSNLMTDCALGARRHVTQWMYKNNVHWPPTPLGSASCILSPHLNATTWKLIENFSLFLTLPNGCTFLRYFKVKALVLIIFCKFFNSFSSLLFNMIWRFSYCCRCGFFQRHWPFVHNGSSLSKALNQSGWWLQWMKLILNSLFLLLDHCCQWN